MFRNLKCLINPLENKKYYSVCKLVLQKLCIFIFQALCEKQNINLFKPAKMTTYDILY